jgi:predicted enzyme related to lactoylglutathione lyase
MVNEMDSIQLSGFTFAVTNMPAMLQFYNTLFHADLQPFSRFGTTLYRGQLAGFSLLFCPNELLGIQAKKNRQQLNFSVPDIEKFVALATANGGAQMQPIHEEAGKKSCGITDPDGNSLEIMQFF